MTSIGQTRTTTKKEQSAEIEQAVKRFLKSGGQINNIKTRKSEFAPTWADYRTTAMESCDE